MTPLKKILGGSFIALVLLLVIGLLSRNIIGVWVTERTLRKLTGLSVKIKALEIKWTFTRVIARQVTILNPPGEYREPRAVEIRLLDGEFKPFSILRQKPYFTKLTIDIPVVVAVRSAGGEINLKRLQSQETAKNPTASRKFMIDEFVISLGEVLYSDEKRNPAKPIVFKVNAQNQTYRNISDPEDVKRLVMNMVIRSLPGNLLGLSIQSVNNGVKTAVDSLKQGGKDALGTVEKGAKSVLDIFGGEKK